MQLQPSMLEVPVYESYLEMWPSLDGLIGFSFSLKLEMFASSIPMPPSYVQLRNMSNVA